MPSIEAQLRDFIATNILFTDDFDYDDDTSFLEAGLLDSMGVMELVTYVGQHWNTDVDPEDVTAANFDSIARLAAYIRRKTHARAFADA